MESLGRCIAEYKKQMEKGDIAKAYQGIMGYIMDLRAYLYDKYPEFSVPGNIYFGYMDMTYFSFTPAELKKRKLKIALVFVHGKFRWEIWLSGVNRQVQAEYARLFREQGWTQYPVSPAGKGVDSIIECTLAEEPNFDDPNALTAAIESGALRFIGDIQKFLADHEQPE